MNLKKIIIYGFSLLILLSIGLGVYFSKKDEEKKIIEDIKPEKLTKENEIIKNEEINTSNIYTKIIPFSQEISDLKYFTDLSQLQIQMLSLMKRNFVSLTTDLDKSTAVTKEKKIDLSNILQNNELKPFLKPSFSLGLLQENPKDENEQMHEIQGFDNFYKLRDKISKKWIFKLKENLKFANGKNIDNTVVIYSLRKQKEIMNNLYKDELNPPENINLLSETNFNHDENNLQTFILSYEKEKNLYDVITLLNNCILFPKEDFELSYSNTTPENSNYGTKEHPFISYGPFELKKENGYNSESDYIFCKNDSFYDKDKYPIQKIVFKKLPYSDEEQYNQEKYNLFNRGEINEIIIKDLAKDISKIDSSKMPNLLYLDTSDQLFVLFNQLSENEDDNQEIKKIKEKSNFFLKDSRFRKALFLGLERNQLNKGDLMGLFPTFSFISDLTLFTDYDFFNQQNFHQQNLDILASTQNTNQIDNNQKFYQPETSKSLLEAVNQDFINRFPQNNAPLIFKIFNGYETENDIQNEKKLTDFVINSWNKVFETNTSCKPIFETVTEGEAQIEIGEGALKQIKNPHTIFIYLYSFTTDSDGNTRKFIMQSGNGERNWELNIMEFQQFMNEMQKIVDSPNNPQRDFDLQNYSWSLAKLEKIAFEELQILPLVKKKVYKIYQNLKTDFENDFILWGLNDFVE